MSVYNHVQTTEPTGTVRAPMTSQSRIEDFLVAVLNARLTNAGKTRADLARALPNQRGTSGVAESSVKRILDRGHRDTQGEWVPNSGPREGWDKWLTAYCALTGDDPVALWREALTAWETDIAGTTRATARKTAKALAKASGDTPPRTRGRR